MQSDHRTSLELPATDAASARHSEQVAAHVRAKIAAAGGSIGFAAFMHEILYAPGLGYYVTGNRKFGAAGDFVTAPEVSPLFGKVLARQCAAALEAVGTREILELGAGSGTLAVDLLSHLSSLDMPCERYLVLEVSPELAARQRALIEERLPDCADKVTWIDTLPADFRGVMIANEVADALPVERFEVTDGGCRQLRVATSGDDFEWQLAEAPADLAAAVGRIEASIGRRLPPGYRSEVCLALAPWVADLVASLESGLMFLFDYGLPAAEYYAPDRSDGWLRCHFRHRAHNDPLILPGIQDVTTWVDFTAAATAAVDAGADICGFVNQAHFLLNGGLEAELAEFPSLRPAAQIELSRQVKLLTLPAEMGEHFKCLGITRGDIDPPPAFAAGDRTHCL